MPLADSVSFADDHDRFPPPSRADDSVLSQTTARSGRSMLGAAIGSVVNPVIGVVDINGVVRRIDVNEVVQRVNWNDVVEEIDWNLLLEQVDVDALVHRVDVNSVVERIDVNALIERSNLKSIIARSTSGICFLALDAFRAICIKTDQLLQRMGRCADCCFCWPDYAKWTLPPLPTVTPIKRRKERHEDRKLRRSMSCPKKSSHLAIAVQGRNAGTCSRFLAFCIDKGLTIGFVFLLVLIIAQLISLVPESNEPSPRTNVNSTQVDPLDLGDGEITQQEQLFIAVGLPTILVIALGFMFDATCLAVIGRTVGKIVMGLAIVDSRHGRVKHLSVYQACLRAALTNVGLFTVFGAFVSLIREDRRSINDLICGTTVIYAWDAKRYRLAEEDIARDMPFGDLESQTSGESPFRRRSSFFVRRKRNGIYNQKARVETKVVTVPVMDGVEL